MWHLSKERNTLKGKLNTEPNEMLGTQGAQRKKNKNQTEVEISREAAVYQEI